MDKVDGRDDIVNTALELADTGIPVFPVNHRKMPAWTLKELGLERGQGGFKIATTDPDEIERLFSHPKTTGIGMPTGKAAGVTIVDVDCGRGKKSRDKAKEWLDAHRDKLRAASVVRTGSGGLHYYCAYTPGISNTGNVWADGVDCRNDGGYVVVPPFMGYSWVRHVDPEDWAPPPPVPTERSFSMRRLAVVGDDRAETPPQIVEMIRLIDEGVTWHDPVRDIVAHLVGSGWSDAEILRQTVQWTKAGFCHRDTFEDLCVMIAGARQKWNRERAMVDRELNAVEAIKRAIPKLTEKQLNDLYAVLGEMVATNG